MLAVTVSHIAREELTSPGDAMKQPLGLVPEKRTLRSEESGRRNLPRPRHGPLASTVVTAHEPVYSASISEPIHLTHRISCNP